MSGEVSVPLSFRIARSPSCGIPWAHKEMVPLLRGCRDFEVCVPEWPEDEDEVSRLSLHKSVILEQRAKKMA